MTTPPAPEKPLILDDTPSASTDARKLERALRLFHLRSGGDGETARGFAPATLWPVLTGDAASWNDEPVRAACGALLGPAPEDEPPFVSPESAAVRLFLRAAQVRSGERRAAFASRTRDLARRLRELLDVDRAKHDSRSPEGLKSAVGGTAAGLIDTAALSGRLGRWRGGAALDSARRERLEKVLETLTSFSWADVPHTVLVHHDVNAAALPSELGGVELVIRESPCTDAVPVFDEWAERFSEVFRAVRVATLEAAGRFDPERHGVWVDHLEPSSFSGEERQLVPILVAVDRADIVSSRDFASFTRLLRSDRPVHLLLLGGPAPTGAGGSDAEEGLDLGYLAIAHRRAFVQQSSVGSPEHLLAGILRAFDDMRPALHSVLTDAGDRERASAGFAAALRARVHPHFRYDPHAGNTWAGRMDFAGNPAPDEDWPDEAVTFQRPNGQEGTFLLPVTLADWALLRPALAGEFRPVPAGFQPESLTPLGEYLALDHHQAVERIPYVWGANDAGHLHRLVVSRRLALVCRERLDFWHTLQELAGIRSEYVLEAVRRTRSELETQAAQERERSEQTHAAELDGARNAAVTGAMQTLANRLLGLDLSAPLESPLLQGLAPTGEAAPAPAAAATAAAAAPPAAAPAAAPDPASNGEPAAVSAEPWIDTPLCTSCNDCTNINSVMFVYDDNKQAVIGDPTAGTFAQLVAAAEKCPARCIHPGTPLNPDEPGLEGLLKRAKPFQ